MQVKAQRIQMVELRIQVTVEQAETLKGMLQNPIGGPDASETVAEHEIRQNLYCALTDAT